MSIDLLKENKTKKQYKAVEELKKYAARKDRETYSSVMQQAIKDKEFERMIRSMSVDLLAGGSTMSKHRYNSKF